LVITPTKGRVCIIDIAAGIKTGKLLNYDVYFERMNFGIMN